MPDVTFTLERPAGSPLKANTRARLRLVASENGDAVGFVDGGPGVGFNATAKFTAVDPQADPVVYVATFADVRANDTITSPANTVYEVTVWEPGGSPLEPNYIAVPDGAGPYEVAEILSVAPTDLSGTRLGDLYDVDTTGADIGDSLGFDGTEWSPVPGGAGLTAENVRDLVAAFIVAGSNVTVTHDDSGDTLTITATGGGGGGLTAEDVRDTIGTALVAGTGISVTVNDAGDTITIAVSGLGIANISGLQAALDALQPLDSDLTAIAALSTTSFGRSLLALADAAAGRTALGLGTAATQATSAFDAAGAAAAAQAASQPLDSDLTAIAALTTTSFGRALLALADAAALTGQVAAASDTAAGKVELATTTETTTGTDTARAVTPAGVKAATDALVAGGTALTGLAGPSGTLDSDDGVLAYEDGTPVIATPLYLSTVVDTAGAVMNTDYDAQTVLAATTNDTPAPVTVAEQRLLGRITGGNVTALTPAQIISIIDDADGTGSGLDADQLDGLEGSAYLVKALASGTADVTNTGGKRLRFNGNYLGIGDISFELFLNGTDTEPVLALASVLGTALRIGLGPGGSTAPDTYIQRGGAGVVFMSGIQLSPGASATTQGRVGARIEDVTTGVGNVGTGEDTLTTITLAASTLSATGQAVKARFAGTIANNANAKRIRLKFGSTTLLDTGASGIGTSVALDWTAEYTVVRTGAATQKAFAELTLSNGTQFVDYTAPTETLANALAVFCTGEATSNDDVRCEVMLVDWEGASPQ